MNPNEQQPPLCTPKRSDTLYHLSSTKSNKSSQSCHSSISSFNSTGTTVHYKNYATHNIKAVPARGVRHENAIHFSGTTARDAIESNHVDEIASNKTAQSEPARHINTERKDYENGHHVTKLGTREQEKEIKDGVAKAQKKQRSWWK